jgi:hypothetical protein
MKMKMKKSIVAEELGGENLMKMKKSIVAEKLGGENLMKMERKMEMERKMKSIVVDNHCTEAVELELEDEAEERGTVAEERGTVAEERGTEAEERGTVAVELGTVAEERGTVAEERGTEAEERDTEAVERGTVAVERGTVAVERGTEAEERGTEAVELGTAKVFDQGVALDAEVLDSSVEAERIGYWGVVVGTPYRFASDVLAFDLVVGTGVEELGTMVGFGRELYQIVVSLVQKKRGVQGKRSWVLCVGRLYQIVVSLVQKKRGVQGKRSWKVVFWITYKKLDC